MDYARAFAVSAMGMSAERSRVEAAAMNLAHANTTIGEGGVAYQPQRAVLRPAAFGTLVADGLHAAGPVATLEPMALRPRLVHEPGHPQADAEGFVAYPGVEPATEMVTLMSAMRSYEANVAALSTARTLALKTLEIGRQP